MGRAQYGLFTATRENVLAAVQRDGRRLERVTHPVYRRDDEVIDAAIRQYPLAIAHVSEFQPTFEKHIKTAVCRNGNALAAIPKRYRHDKLLCELACTSNPRAFLHVLNPIILHDYDFADAYRKHNVFQTNYFPYIDEGPRRRLWNFEPELIAEFQMVPFQIYLMANKLTLPRIPDDIKWLIMGELIELLQ